jgi:hypothetical protein
MDAGKVNPFAEPGELIDLLPRKEIAMSPDRVSKYILLAEFALDAAESDLPEPWRTRAACILKLAPVQLPYTPPALPVSGFAEAVAEERE